MYDTSRYFSKNTIALLVCAVFFLFFVRLAYAAGTQTFSTPGSFQFTVPVYNTMTVSVWGGGGTGTGLDSVVGNYVSGGTGQASSFNGTVIANGGVGGANANGGAGGTASGGDTNTSGTAGGAGIIGCSGAGGGSPNGGAGGAAACPSNGLSSQGNPGGSPGAGGSGYILCLKGCTGAGVGGGGGAGYAVKTYVLGAIAVGTNVAVVVGAGGNTSTQSVGSQGGLGAPGQVTVTWTDIPNLPPVIPTITGPTTGFTNVSYTFTLSGATDPEGNTIRYAVDWDNNSTVDEYAPTSGTYVASGTSKDVSHTWTTSGAKTIQARSEDSLGNASGWKQHTITISALPVVLLTASSPSFREGDAPIGLTWSSSNAVSCVGTNFSTGGALNGSTSVTPTVTTTYTLTCTNANGSSQSAVTVTYSVNQAPSAPTISGAQTGKVGTAYQYTLTSTDPEGDQVKNGIDCNNDGTIDSWASLANSGTPQVLSCSWPSTGTYTVRGKAQDSRGAFSGFSATPVSIIVTAACTNCTPMTGYMWSDTVGWISLSCQNNASCATSSYGLEVDPNGVVSGYAWSENIGWVSAEPGDIVGCPSGSNCTPSINGTNGQIFGWFRALAALGTQSGGWDGWISLSCQNNSSCGTISYGPTLDFNTNTFSGFAWGGGTVIGWVDLKYASSTFTALSPGTSCLNPNTLRTVAPDLTVTDTPCPYAAYGYGCQESGGSAICLIPPNPGPTGANAANDLKVSPRLVRKGNTTTVSWDIEDAASCTVTGTNGDSWTGVSGSHVSSPITTTTVYTLNCSSTVPGFTYTASATVNIVPIFQEI